MSSAADLVPPRKKIRWGSVIFLIGFNLATFIVLPLYVWHHGVSRLEMSVFAFYFLATSFAITIGYHRYFAHSTFKAGSAVSFLLLFFGAASFEQSALKWASLHRRHHQYTDTELDPYNIKKGFFYAHMGWIMFWRHSMDYDNAKDLQKSALVMHQHNYYQAWAILSGILVPLVIGAIYGNVPGVLLWGVVARMTLVFHSAFFINSFAHTFGTRRYDPGISARDNWFGAFLTNGEGYHNFHHKFPQDYRNGIRWYHWDPTKWVIWTLSKVGLASGLRTTPDKLISAARLAALPIIPIERAVVV